MNVVIFFLSVHSVLRLLFGCEYFDATLRTIYFFLCSCFFYSEPEFACYLRVHSTNCVRTVTIQFHRLKNCHILCLDLFNICLILHTFSSATQFGDSFHYYKQNVYLFMTIWTTGKSGVTIFTNVMYYGD